jgi:hypothetical protein
MMADAVARVCAGNPCAGQPPRRPKRSGQRHHLSLAEVAMLAEAITMRGDGPPRGSCNGGGRCSRSRC